ncbi:gliding motility-associated C-terminal domain-containing protein, partial [uncultured Lutibacter sp.]|uniref:gliding motility-associated C-terminal domain-containing protein n=1 Tax=uncultured Lutibacter sp. TaxID=437739 RepID=UPI0026204140
SGSTVQGDASYLWSTGATTSSIEVTAAGEYTVTVTDSINGCSSTETVMVSEDTTAVVASITGNETLTCTITSVVLDASGSTVQGDASYLWSTGATTSSIEVTAAGEYTVTVTDSTNGCSSTETVAVSEDNTTVNEVVNICDDLFDGFGNPVQTVDLNDYLSLASDTSGTWEAIDIPNRLNGSLLDVVELENGEYRFNFTSSTGCVSQLTVVIDCAVLACVTPDEISKVVTPNNDGINDTFNVGLVGASSCKYIVEIFNRWGKMVYESKDYKNTWGGYHNNSGLTIGSSAKLPAGTYYYIVKVIDSGGQSLEPITGYIYLGTH